MKTIYKFILDPAGVNVISAPGLGGIVLAGTQGDQHWVVWAECDTGELVANKLVWIVGTGHELPPAPAQHAYSYVDEPFVWHIYDQYVNEVN